MAKPTIDVEFEKAIHLQRLLYPREGSPPPVPQSCTIDNVAGTFKLSFSDGTAIEAKLADVKVTKGQ